MKKLTAEQVETVRCALSDELFENQKHLALSEGLIEKLNFEEGKDYFLAFEYSKLSPQVYKWHDFTKEAIGRIIQYLILNEKPLMAQEYYIDIIQNGLIRSGEDATAPNQ